MPVMKNLHNKGQALVVSYLVISAFIVISAALSSKAVSERSLALRNKLTAEAFYLAEGATENAISALTSGIANYQLDVNIPSLNVTTSFATFSGAVVNSTITELNSTDRLVTEGQTKIWVRNYEVVSSAQHPQNANINVTVHQIIARRLIPTFQHSVFYDDDLEILPGANMNLSGRIHCNNDIYMDADSGATLKVNSTYVHSAGNIYNKRKNNGSRLSGEVEITRDKPGAPDYEAMDNLDCDSANWTTAATDRWDGSVQSSVHGVTELTAPSVASIQPGGYYASNADVVITETGIVKGGVPLREGVDYPNGTVTINQTLYDNREGSYIRTVNVDLSKLANLAGESPGVGQPAYANNLPSNGLMYVTVADVAGTQPGVRLFNGATIDRSGGLTIVSNDPVYIQGDYNTVDEKPAAVICDSLNILSNRWNDANSPAANWASRTANQTTINSAFIAGVDTTTSGNYNGGLENYPRLHENWSGINLNIKGSFVALWESQVADGSWAYGSPRYTAPRRNWYYNTAFNNPSNLPPFTPWAVEAQRIAWWQE